MKGLRRACEVNDWWSFKNKTLNMKQEGMRRSPTLADRQLQREEREYKKQSKTYSKLLTYNFAFKKLL